MEGSCWVKYIDPNFFLRTLGDKIFTQTAALVTFPIFWESGNSLGFLGSISFVGIYGCQPPK